MSTLVILFGTILIHVIPATLIFIWAWKKGHASLRLMAILSAITQISLGFFAWLAIKEDWVFTVAIIFSILTSINLLALPITAPKLFKKLKIKW